MTSTRVYRLAKEKPGHYAADDLSGNGAALSGGRWNPRGMRVLYTCCAASTALLESLVHMAGLMPRANFYLIVLELPQAELRKAYVPEMPPDWFDITRDPASTAAIGKHWIEQGKQLAMKVPSVVSPTDFNLLLNPLHPQMASVRVVEKRPFQFDARLFG
ncbi:MAG: RES family NAD+ phosphorylase [Herbaspirillum sp.]|nr:RES family NAD+ phosphorylase [Herbaspirillum sp.]